VIHTTVVYNLDSWIYLLRHT